MCHFFRELLYRLISLTAHSLCCTVNEVFNDDGRSLDKLSSCHDQHTRLLFSFEQNRNQFLRDTDQWNMHFRWSSADVWFSLRTDMVNNWGLLYNRPKTAKGISKARSHPPPPIDNQCAWLAMDHATIKSGTIHKCRLYLAGRGISAVRMRPGVGLINSWSFIVWPGNVLENPEHLSNGHVIRIYLIYK